MSRKTARDQALDRLGAFYDAKTFGVGEWRPTDTPESALSSDRYLPLAYDDGGNGWGVYDQGEGRFLDHAEVLALSEDQLMFEKVGHA